MPFAQTTRAIEAERSALSVVAWGLGAAFLVAWATWVITGRVAIYETSAKARLEVRDLPHEVATVQSGRVSSLNLAIGREVAADDVLLELDAAQERLRLAEEEARLAGLPGRIASLGREREALGAGRDTELEANAAALDALRARRHETDAAITFARQNERRLREQGAAGGVAQIDALRAAAELQRLLAVRDGLTADLRRLEVEGRTRAYQIQARLESIAREIAAHEAEVATTGAAVGRLRAAVEQHVLRAPVAGQVAEAAPLTIGAYVAAGQRVASIVPSGDLVVVAEFNPATALGRVREGQMARVRLDGFPWPQYGALEARVARVAGEVRGGTLRVELAPLPAPHLEGVLRHGLPGSVEVEIEEVAPATLLLRSAGLMLAAAPRAPPADARR